MPRQSKKKSTDNVNNEGIINVLDSDKKKRKTIKKKGTKTIKSKVVYKDSNQKSEINTQKSSTSNTEKVTGLKKNILSDFEELMENTIDKSDAWDVMDSYFNQSNKRQIISHQFFSYEQFIEKYISDVLTQFNPIKVYHDYQPELNKHTFEMDIEFINYNFGNPTITELDGETIHLTPSIARLRNLTYSRPLNIDIKFTRTIYSQDEDKFNDKGELIPNLDISNTKDVIMKNVNFGYIPIMVNSKFCTLSKNTGITMEQQGECRYDMGGYFIINGNEKVIVGQERIAENKIFVFNKQKQNKNKEFEAEVRCIVDDCFSIVVTNIVKYFEKENTFHIILPTFKQPINIFLLIRALGIDNDKDMINLICQDLSDSVLGSNFTLMLKDALLEFKVICQEECIHTPEEVMNYLVKFLKYKGLNKDIKLDNLGKINYLKNGLTAEFLPQMRTNTTNKLHYLGCMVRKLIKVRLGLIDFDDRDSFQNKRVETAGYLMASLFRQCLNRLIKDMTKSITKELNHNKSGKDIFDIITINNITKVVKPTSIEGGIKYALATGNWGVKTNGKGKIKVGTAQVLNRLSYLSYLSHLRRLICPSDKKKKNNKIVYPRKLHNTQWGFICPAETPEGAPVGLVKNMSLGSTITIQYNSGPVREWIKRTGLRYFSDINSEEDKKALKDMCYIMVNGDLIGYHNNPVKFYHQFKHLRRGGVFNPYITIFWNIEENIINIFSDAGRLIRPVYTVSNNQLNIRKGHIEYLKQNNYNWSYLINPVHNKILQRMPMEYYQNCKIEDDEGGFKELEKLYEYSTAQSKQQSVIEFIDNEETCNCMIAMTPEMLDTEGKQYQTSFTHCEIHPGLILGVLASVIPFPDHNQSPRNAYQSSMGKQAMGCSATNFLKRMDTLSYVMNSLERPIVFSRFGEYTNYNKLPVGLNAMVAIACYGGYNQEDSIIMNQNSIDNGLFRTTFYHVYKDEEKKIQSNGKEEKFCKPDPEYTKGIKPGNYDKLDERGFVKENEFVTSKDVIIGKKLPIKNKYLNGHQVFKDCSTSLRMNESGYIDRVFIDRNEEGFVSGKVRIRNERVPGIGSKFASRVGQKGTVGMMYPREHMPFTESGLVPDIIMTPHAIPSRMTVGQLLECLMGKASVKLGGFSECTAFSEVSQDKVGDILEENGFEYCGNEVMYSGITGKQMEVQIFFGPTYYQRLKHMVEDKMHCLTMDHLIYTKKGWKPFTQIKMNTSVATFNSRTDRLEWHTPLETHHYCPRRQTMYHILNDYIDTSITEEHRLWIKEENDSRFSLQTATDVYDNLQHKNDDGFIVFASMDLESNEITEFQVFKNNIYKSDMVEEVFCLTVPNEKFLVKRGDKHYWTGNSRNSGPVVQLTRQPAEGRSRDGGLRIGEMEKDCMSSHGAVGFMKERLLDVSDKFNTYVCGHCGNYAIVNPDEDIQLYRCNLCETYNSFRKISIPYASKLLNQELQGLGINTHYKF